MAYAAVWVNYILLFWQVSFKCLVGCIVNKQCWPASCSLLETAFWENIWHNTVPNEWPYDLSLYLLPISIPPYPVLWLCFDCVFCFAIFSLLRQITPISHAAIVTCRGKSFVFFACYISTFKILFCVDFSTPLKNMLYSGF